MIKLIFALLYQEKHVKLPGFNKPAMIELGGFLVSYMNSYADSLTGFT